ncbi:MAG: hypothetical protein NTV46_08885 [Verrucomicrobia bacterium]|nr:hypothetical protein [Verrucomicrobiota bacterium]
MSDSDNDPLSSLLSSFALGPSWARATGGPQETTPKHDFPSEDRPPRRDNRRGDDRGSDNRGGDNRRGDDRRSDDRRGGARGRDGGNRTFQDRGGKPDERRDGPPRIEEAPPAEGVRVTLIPDPQAVHLIGKEIQHVARVYPLYDVAKILLAERARCRAVFEAPDPHPPLWRGKIDECVFLTREEAIRHLWQSDLRKQFIEEETIEVDPPTGNFQSVARCGISGAWLGPPNFHAYQVNLRRLHRERFPHMPFAVYSAKVRTERGEDAVNAWLETMKQKTHWRIKDDADDAWIDERSEAERTLAARCVERAFAEVRYTEVLASIAPSHLSPSLMTSLKLSGNHARNHPAILIPSVCRAIEAEHLPVFKRQGKLLTGPARPHPLPVGAILAERPGIMVAWIRANKPAKLEGLWKAVLPEGGTAPPSEFAADLFWLLHQGHILLFTDDTLSVQEVREPPTPDPTATLKTNKTHKKKSGKPKSPDDAAADENSSEEPSSEESSADESSSDPSHPSHPSHPADPADPPENAELSQNPSPGVDVPADL